MPNRAVVLLALAGCLPGTIARADFRLQTAMSASAGHPISGNSDSATSSAPAPAPAPASASVFLGTDDGTPAPAVRPKVPYARGFGHAVPLSFAARQIVPRNVTVRFGAEVDQSLPVDWTGGRPWNLVMGAAVKPLHLHLTFSATSVLIS